MSSRILNGGLTATVATLGLLAGFSTALAGGHELWRDQVKTATAKAVTLEEGGSVPATGNYKFWREQVKGDQTEAVTRYVATTRAKRAAPAYLFWREHVKTHVEGVAQTAAANR